MSKITYSELEFIVKRVLQNATDAAEEDDGTDFFDGKKLAYYEILDTIKSEFIVRGVDLKPLGLDICLESLL